MRRLTWTFEQPIYLGESEASPSISSWAGTPEGAVAAPVGSLCVDSLTGALYQKTSGSGNTGWEEFTGGGGEPPSVAGAGWEDGIVVALVGGENGTFVHGMYQQVGNVVSATFEMRVGLTATSGLLSLQGLPVPTPFPDASTEYGLGSGRLFTAAGGCSEPPPSRQHGDSGNFPHPVLGRGWRD
jgi:hypothetical protein